MSAVTVRRRGSPGLIRRNLPLAGVLLLLGILILVSALRGQPATPIPYDLNSTAPNGLRALYLWLEALGYRVQRTDGLTYRIPPGADLIFVYPNQLSYSAEEADALHAWVEAGGTLSLVGPHPEDAELERAFGVRARPQTDYGLLEQQTQPLLPEGKQDYLGDWGVEPAVLDLTDAPNAVPVLTTSAGNTAMAVQTIGDGVVWHLTPGNGFLNRSLSNQDNGEMLPAILRTVRPGGLVVFDTYHLFGLSRVGEQISTLQDWLYRTPTGWATLVGVLVLGLFLVLQGRRLGPSVPTWAERRRREAAEYVEAMAALARRAHMGDDVARHQKRRLKRGLARRRPFSPDLDDAQFMERLAQTDPPLAAATLAEVKATLRALDSQPREQQLVELAAKVDEILRSTQSM